MAALSQLYARIPYGVTRKVIRGCITEMNISTPNLRKLLADKAMPRDIKNKLYSFALYRRHDSRRKRHGHSR